MSQNLYFNTFLSSFFIISFLYSGILEPELDDVYPEILYKNNKGREYYEVTKNGLEYNVKGPAEVKIFSKAAFQKKRLMNQSRFIIIY